MTQRRKPLPCLSTLSLTAAALTAALACGSDDGTGALSPTLSTGGPTYALAFNVNTPDGNTVGYLGLHRSLAIGRLDPSTATELGGGSQFVARGKSVFVGDGERQTYTRYDLVGGTLVRNRTINFTNEGMSFLYQADIVSDTQAYSINDKGHQLVEWNPETMTITARHDLSSLQRPDFQIEWRNAETMHRPSDGALFLYFAYTNDRKSYANALHVALFDTRTGKVELLKDERCGETAGFGGWMDEGEATTSARWPRSSPASNGRAVSCGCARASGGSILTISSI